MRKEKLDEAYELCKNKKWIYVDENSGEEKKAELSWETPEVQESCNSIWGIQEQLFLSLRMNHPKITKEKCSEIVSLHNYGRILNKLLTVTGLVEESSEGNDDSGDEDDESSGIEIFNL